MLVPDLPPLSKRGVACPSVRKCPLKTYTPAVGLTGVHGNERMLGVAW